MNHIFSFAVLSGIANVVIRSDTLDTPSHVLVFSRRWFIRSLLNNVV